MVLADGTLNNGANRDAIRNAFTRHNIVLGTNAMLAPRAALAGAAPRLTARAGAAILGADTIRDIKRRLDLPAAAKLAVEVIEVGGHRIARAEHRRAVSLGRVAKELKGVVAMVPDQVLVGGVEKSAAMLSAMPEPFTTEDEVQSFVATLLAHGQLAVERGVAAARSAVASRPSPNAPIPTHAIVTRRGRKVLERLRFSCRADKTGCGCLVHSIG